MRIVHVIHGFLPQFRGGTELYLLGLARAQRDLGHEVEIITGTTDAAEEARAERYEFDGFPVTKIVLAGSYLEHWTRSFSPVATRLFVEALRRIRPDMVHVQHWYRLSRSLLESCHRLGIPAVCTLHDLWTTCPRIFRIRDETFCDRPLSVKSCRDCVPRFPFMDDRAAAAEVDLFRADFGNEMRLARRIIVPSRAHGEVIADSADVPEDRLVVLPHGSIIGLDGSRPEAQRPRRRDPARKRSFGRRGPIRLGLWGHLFHMKGVHILLEALGLLGKKAQRFDLQIWGKVVEPRYKARLEELAADLDVTWRGAYKPADLAAVELDCAVIPSLCSESFSFVLDEAFDLGLPAIVSDRGALAERVGQAGAVFEAENARSLALVLERLADEPERLLRWREAIPRLEPMAMHAREVLTLYVEVLQEGARADIAADPGLPWRRLEHQTDMLRRYESVMFGQIGHIKREAGRGDHYEGETRKLMHEKELWAARRAELEGSLQVLKEAEAHEKQIISVLAAEIENFRRALVAYLRGDLGFTPERSEFADLPEHVPGLGPVSVLVDHDHELLTNYGQELARRRGDRKRWREESEKSLARKDEVIALLGKEVQAFRELLLEIEAAEPRFERPRPSAPEIPDHVPELGPIARVLRENHEFMSAHFANLTRRLAEARAASARFEELEKDRRLAAETAELLAAAEEREAEALRKLAEADQRLAEMDFELETLRPEPARAEELARRLERQELLVETLAELLEEIRRGIVAVWDPELRYLPHSAGARAELLEHVPGHGDVATIQAVNRKMVAELLEEVRRLRGAAAPEGDPSQ